MSWHQAHEQDMALDAVADELTVAIDHAEALTGQLAIVHDLLVDLGESHPEFHELATYLDNLYEEAHDNQGEVWLFFKAIQGILAAHNGG